MLRGRIEGHPRRDQDAGAPRDNASVVIEDANRDGIGAVGSIGALGAGRSPARFEQAITVKVKFVAQRVQAASPIGRLDGHRHWLPGRHRSVRRDGLNERSRIPYEQSRRREGRRAPDIRDAKSDRPLRPVVGKRDGRPHSAGVHVERHAVVVEIPLINEGIGGLIGIRCSGGVELEGRPFVNEIRPPGCGTGGRSSSSIVIVCTLLAPRRRVGRTLHREDERLGAIDTRIIPQRDDCLP